MTPARTLRSPRTAALLAAAAVIAPAATSAASAETKLTGDPEGVQLARDVDAAYAGVPAIRSRALLTGKGIRFRIATVDILEGGLVVRGYARVVVDSVLVETVDTPTGAFERRGGKGCWTRTGEGSVGDTVFTRDGERFDRPTQGDPGTLVLTGGTDKGARVRAIIAADTKTLLRLTVTDAGLTLSVTYRTLTSTPAIPRITRRCEPPKRRSAARRAGTIGPGV
ncbi:MAG: hypothetical protein AB1416_02665 [Actinomycetota bacterium]